MSGKKLLITKLLITICILIGNETMTGRGRISRRAAPSRSTSRDSSRSSTRSRSPIYRRSVSQPRRSESPSPSRSPLRPKSPSSPRRYRSPSSSLERSPSPKPHARCASTTPEPQAGPSKQPEKEESVLIDDLLLSDEDEIIEIEQRRVTYKEPVEKQRHYYKQNYQPRRPRWTAPRRLNGNWDVTEQDLKDVHMKVRVQRYGTTLNCERCQESKITGSDPNRPLTRCLIHRTHWENVAVDTYNNLKIKEKEKSDLLAVCNTLKAECKASEIVTNQLSTKCLENEARHRDHQDRHLKAIQKEKVARELANSLRQQIAKQEENNQKLQTDNQNIAAKYKGVSDQVSKLLIEKGNKEKETEDTKKLKEENETLKKEKKKLAQQVKDIKIAKAHLLACQLEATRAIKLFQQGIKD